MQNGPPLAGQAIRRLTAGYQTGDNGFVLSFHVNAPRPGFGFRHAHRSPFWSPVFPLSAALTKNVGVNTQPPPFG